MYKERDIENLWLKYEKLLSNVKLEGIDKLLEEFGQRIVESSYSQRDKEVFCGIAGNVEYSLTLAKNANVICKALNYDINSSSIIKCSLLSILGRVGTQFEDRLKESESEWHREKLGQYYEWNESCPKYSINHMTLYHLQRFGVNLLWDEFEALSLLKDMSSEDNKFYGMHKSRLSVVLNLAHEATIKDELDKIKGVYTVPF